MIKGKRPCEGDIYKELTVGGRVFKLVYGFYSDSERETGEMVPLLPDFESAPLHTEGGLPFVTHIQDACPSYSPKRGEGDLWCSDCIHFKNDGQEIGVCLCESNRLVNC